jgi:hypothetical protein
MDVLIQFFVSSTCFEHHVLIIRKTICTLIFKKCTFCWFTLHNCITMHGTKKIKNKFYSRNKNTYCLFQCTIREALISFNKRKINCRTVTQLLQGPCMKLLSFMINYTYLNFICISTPRLFLYVHLHVETNNR